MAKMFGILFIRVIHDMDNNPYLNVTKYKYCYICERFIIDEKFSAILINHQFICCVRVYGSVVREGEIRRLMNA